MKTFLRPSFAMFTSQIFLMLFAMSFLFTAESFPHQNKLDLNGTITSVIDSSVSVDGLTLTVTENTEIKDQEGNTISLSDLMTGDFVKTKSELLPDGSFIATEIEIKEDEEHESELEVKAFIDEIDSSSILLSGIQVFADEETELKRNAETIQFEDLMVGDFAEVKAKYTSGGYFLADEIKVETEFHHEEEFETEGFITEIGDSSLVVNGYTFFVDEYTDIKDHDSTISFNELNVGDFVEVEAEILPDSSLLATKIKLEDDHENEIEFTGMIESIVDSSLVVNGMLVYVNYQTEIFGEGHEPISFSDLMVGMYVEVKAFFQPDSTLLATRIKVEEEGEIEFTGTIESIDISSLVVNGITVFVNEDTEIFANHHEPISFSDLTVGMTVEIKALLQPDSTLLATRIKVEDENEQHIQITAPIDTIIASSIVVDGITFETDSNTQILDNDRNPISFEDLETGMIVKVKGTLLSPGTYMASRIWIRDFWHHSTDVAGNLASVSSYSVEIGNNEFLITSNTVILDETGNPVTLSYLQNGMVVNLRSIKNNEGTNEAVRIKVRHPDEIDYSGIINNISANNVTIGNQIVELQNYTFITFVNGEVIQTGGLKTGEFVNTQILFTPGQTDKATYISVTQSPDIVKTTGKVIEKTNDLIIISQSVFQVNNSTVILNRDFHPADYNSINIGDVVTLWAKNIAEGNPLTLQIQSLSNNTTNVNNNGNETVTEYTLSQNFPNPFNPSTKIRFTIPERAFVSLQVFNIIGEQIALLINENLEAGVYDVNFDASRLPSGVYIYKITANKFSQTHKMLLLK